MEISEGIEIADLGIYLPREKILVFSDFHIGYEESLNKQGIFIPRHQFEDTKRRLENLFSKIKDVETIIITGDLKHEFGTISGQEWREVFAIIDLMQKHCKKLVILKGNHDVVLQSMLRKKNLEVRNDYCI
ncbi:MAG: metallophosphoesterase, partial [Candidatus Nanoarchaeia archaeon]